MSGALMALFQNLRSFGGASRLYSWGYGVNSQTGLNTTATYSSPVQVGALTTWSSVSCGSLNSVAIKTDGTLWTWGRATQGQLGLNNTTTYASPMQVGLLTTWSKLPTGGCAAGHNAVIKTDGTLWTWGQGTSGQLGLGTATARSSPVQVGALTTWSKVACGLTHTIAIATDGTLWTWGLNLTGQLGLGTTTNRSSPVQVGVLTTWYSVACGLTYTMAIMTDGTLWAWGENSTYGQLGDGTKINRSDPVQVGALTTWSQIVCGNQHTIAIMTAGTLWTWGYNGYGGLGQNISTTINRSSPVQVGALTTWSNPTGGDFHTGCIKTDGTLWLWGRGNNGQLGNDNALTFSSPVQTGTLTTWSKVAGGPLITSAIESH